MPRWVLLVCAGIAGGGLSFQAGVNAQLRRFVGSPFRSGLVNFLVGASVLLVVVTFTHGTPPVPKQTAWWMWTGGLFGTMFVVGSVLLAPRLGAGSLAAALVSGQLIAAIVIDHFGLLGYRVLPLSWPRLLGVVVLLIGVLLIQRGR